MPRWLTIKAIFASNRTHNRRVGFLATEADIDYEPRLLFTAPWEPVVVRRGDALGLRALADQFAEALAPGLSNRVRDGRWITILAWCLARSQEVFHASGGRSVGTRAEQRERYAWLRPLELMWVARTIALAEDWRERSLAGQRRVSAWYEFDEQSTDRFGMSEDQFRAYRQTGRYGGYRVAFRNWPGMTVLGNGWTPGPLTIRLAQWLDGKLGAAQPPWTLSAGDDDEDSVSPRSAKLGRGKEHHWWLRQWPMFAQGGKNAELSTLPRRNDDFAELPEANHLKAMMFGKDQNGKKRLGVATELGKASARDHIEVCEHLSRAFASDNTFTLLPRFSRLADAGMAAMELIANSLQNDIQVKLADVAALPAAIPICDKLVAAAQEWRRHAQIQVRHIESAHRFASAMTSAQPIQCLRTLLRHHEVYGGGLQWFVLRNGRVEPRTPWRGGSSRYRFRLWSLCRLAAQCGVLPNMPRALLAEDDPAEEDTSENVRE
jgi:hypothetical protein